MELNEAWRFYTVSAPSGTGKSTMCKLLRASTPGLYHAVSRTTRALRDGETHDDYIVVTDAEMDALAGQFISGDVYNGHRYHDLWPPDTVDLALFEVTLAAARHIREQWPNTVNVWLDPVGDDEDRQIDWLARRLDGRESETAESKQRRLAAARCELAVVNALDPSTIVRRVNADSAETAKWMHDMIVATAA